MGSVGDQVKFESAAEVLNVSPRSEQRRPLRVDDRTEQLFADVGFYWSAGQVWKSLLAALGVGDEGRVVEFACGVVPKVGAALHYGTFHGTLDLVDLSQDSLARASRWLELLGCRFTHTARCSSIVDLEEAGYHGIFANHAIDDLVLHAYCARTGGRLDPLFENGTNYIETWAQLVRDTAWLPAVIAQLADTLVAALGRGGVVVMCDYESHSHRELGVSGVIEVVRNLQSLLRVEFSARGMSSIESKLPLRLESGRFELSRRDVIAFRKGEACV
jgi:hypothetical protein